VWFVNAGSYEIDIVDKHNVTGLKVQELSYNTVHQFDFNRFFNYPRLVMANFGMSNRTYGGKLDNVLNSDTNELKVRYGACSGGFAKLKNSTNIQYIYMEFCPNFTGNIEDLAGCLNLETLHLFQCNNVIGDVSDLIRLTSLTEMALGAGVGGSVESFVNGQIANGRTTETNGIACNNLIAYRTFGGRTYAGVAVNMEQWLCWESAEKVVVYARHLGESKPSNKEAANHVYIINPENFTSEISTWKAAGKTVINAATGEQL
jgi:hypothetical protein